MAKSVSLSEEIMDFFKQFFDKTPDGVPEDIRFFDRLLEMRVSREKLGVFAALAVSTSMFFYFWGRPQQASSAKQKKTKGILKTTGCQTIEGGMVSTTISVSGYNTPTVCVSSPQPSQCEDCCAGECEQPASAANVEEQPSTTGEVQPERRPCALLATWTSRGQRPSFSVNFKGANEGVNVSGNGRKKRVTFSKSVVEPSGDNEVYRRNPRSGAARQVGKGTRRRDADPILDNGDLAQKTNENCTYSSTDTRQPCHPDNIRTPIDEYVPRQTGEQQVSGETVKGCRHTRTADQTADQTATQQATYPLKQQDRNRLPNDSSVNRYY